jgi:FkbM family methyltransferase
MDAIVRAAKSARVHFDLFGIRGVLRRAMLLVPGLDNTFLAPIPGSCRDAIIRLGTTDVAAFEHVFINNEYGIALVLEPRVIIDAGAHVGMSALYFSHRYPAAKIIAIEPEPANFEVLKRNADRFSNVVPINAALWNYDGTVSIQNNDSGSWGSRVAAIDSGYQVRSVKVTTLLQECDIDKIDLFKIDVEGAECEIFEDAPEWIDRVEVLCAELHDRFRPGCSSAFENATASFPIRWQRGELSCVARDGSIIF